MGYIGGVVGGYIGGVEVYWRLFGVEILGIVIVTLSEVSDVFVFNCC